MAVSDSELEIWIVKKLVRHGYWSKGHISADNLINLRKLWRDTE